jgi:hypothetical protein
MRGEGFMRMATRPPAEMAASTPSALEAPLEWLALSVSMSCSCGAMRKGLTTIMRTVVGEI